MAYVINFGEGGGVYANFLGNGGSVIPDPGPGPDPDPGQDDPYSDLSTGDITLRDDAINRINHIKSLCKTGNTNHDVMVFGLITDLHTFPSKEEILADDTIEQEDKDAWPSKGGYYDQSAEGSIKLLGSICHEIDADAVFCGGDLSSGGGLSKDLYGIVMEKIRQMFDKYISVPHFITDGNHDIKYDSKVEVRGNEEWLAYLKRFNTPDNPSTHSVKYLENEYLKEDHYTSTSYCVDFKKRKVRAFMASKYEDVEYNGSSAAHGGGSGPSHNNTYAAFAMEDPADAENWTVLSVTHNCTGSSTAVLSDYYIEMFLSGEDFSIKGSSAGSGLRTKTNPNIVNGVRHKGKAYVGMLGGHWHDNREFLTSDCLSALSIANCHAKGTRVFSMFVLDTTAFKLYEVKVGTQWVGYSGNNFRSDASVSPYGWFEYDIRHS